MTYGVCVCFQDGHSALHLAVRRCQVEVVHCLLRRCCCVDHQDRHGNSPLHIACKDGNLPIVMAICNAKASLDLANKVNRTTHPKLYLSHGREKKKQSALLLSVWLDVLSSDWLYLCSCCKNCIYSGLCWQCSVSNTWYAVWFQRHIFPHKFLLRRFYFDTLYFNGFSDGITFFTHTNISSRTIQTGGVHQQTTAALPEVMFAFLHLALKKRHQSPLSLDVKDFSWHN